MERPLCSVLIVNFNVGPLLIDVVRAALASEVDVEVLVWDNASRDGSIEGLESRLGGQTGLRIIRHDVNVGFAAANNRLLALAKGEWLLLLNPDCLVTPDTIGSMIAELAARPQVGMAGCLICNADGSEQAGCRRRVPTPWRTLVRILYLDKIFPRHQGFQGVAMNRTPLPRKPTELEAISGAFMLVRRAALEAVGPLDEDYFLHCEDLDWCMRFHKQGWDIIFVPGVKVVHHQGSCSQNRLIFSEWHKHKGMLLFYRKFFRDQYPVPFMWLVTVAVWSRFVIMACRRGLYLGWRFMAAKLRGAAAGRVAIRPGRDGEGAAGPEQMLVEHGPERQVDERTLNSVLSGRLAGVVLPRRVLVTGATSQIGYFLLPLLAAAGIEYIAVSRRPPSSFRQEGRWVQGDLLRDNPFACAGSIDCWFHLAKLPLALPWLAAAGKAGVRHFLGFSSTSLFTKQQSSCPEEQQFVEELQWAEKEIAAICPHNGIDWTLLRPTMIYGCGLDRNVSFILSTIKRFGVFPLVGEGKGLRQPVHAADLALVALMAVCVTVARNRAYNLGGGESLTYREMVERLFVSLGRRPRFLTLPLGVAKGCARVARLCPGFEHLTPAMFERMKMDMVVDYQEAVRDLEYMPRPFAYQKSVT